jgi:hypothetical protein
MEAICSSETSVKTQRTTRSHIPEDDILHNHRRENLKSYREISCLLEILNEALSMNKMDETMDQHRIAFPLVNRGEIRRCILRHLHSHYPQSTFPSALVLANLHYAKQEL